MNIRMLVRVLHALEQLRKHEGWTREQLEAYQSEQVRRLRAYAYAHSPFYQQFHKGLESRPLHELPILTKAMLMEHFNNLVTDRTLRLADVRTYAAQGQAGKRYRNHY
jgi:phenylacetate-CoA ligase